MELEKYFDGRERRKYIRIKELLTAKFMLIDRKNFEIISDWRKSHTRDLSRGGACVEVNGSHRELKELKDILNKKPYILELEVTLPSDKKISAKADIHYVRMVGSSAWNYLKKEMLEIGIRFSDLSAENEKLISEFVVETYVEKYGSIKKD